MPSGASKFIKQRQNMQNETETTFINIKNYYNVQKGASASLYKRGAAEAALTFTVQISKRSGAF